MEKPIQPIKDGRFIPNKVVEYLLEKGGLTLNDLPYSVFPQEDLEQFAQLIGYSLNGYSELSYVSDEAYEAAHKMSENTELSNHQAVNESLREQLSEARKGVKAAATALFKIHPDDLSV